MVFTGNTACGTETVPHPNNSEKRHRRDTHVAFLWWNFNFFVNFLRTFGELFAANANQGFFLGQNVQLSAVVMDTKFHRKARLSGECCRAFLYP